MILGKGLCYNFKHILKAVAFIKIIVNRGKGLRIPATSKKQSNVTVLRVMLEGLHVTNFCNFPRQGVCRVSPKIATIKTTEKFARFHKTKPL